MNAKTIEKKKLRKEKLNIFFDKLILRCVYSEESNRLIPNPNRTNICHIFPKRTYHSIEDNLDNHIFLTFTEHTRFDNLLDKLRFEELEGFMCWGVVCERVRKLLPVTTENGSLKSKFQEYLSL